MGSSAKQKCLNYIKVKAQGWKILVSNTSQHIEVTKKKAIENKYLGSTTIENCTMCDQTITKDTKHPTKLLTGSHLYQTRSDVKKRPLTFESPLNESNTADEASVTANGTTPPVKSFE